QGYVNTAAFVHGDDNADGKTTVSDVVYEINYLFKGGPAPLPPEVGDVNCDNKHTVADVVYKINYLFKGGPPPCNL
ncbi:MAG: dockerin type I domain-containing protein, partial [candidate division Zixibacteria bacterium]|nr:dockerin type I domain-containing protein [candidate division Zixibacteria bacterium]